MSDLEAHPEAAICEATPGPGPRTDSYPSREVPLGGVRGVTVHRVLPQRDLPTVGAWCFLDHFGSTAPSPDLPPDIDPHPHIGLQTVTWPFEGQIRHRDSIGSDVEIEPGQLNLMTSGHGIAHSEYTVPGAPAGPLLYLGSDRADLSLSSSAGAHAILIGGEPFGEDLVMWWNFVARSHDEIQQARNDWEKRDLDRFADIAGHPPEQRIPAPPLPNLRLKPRKRRAG